MRDRTVVRLWAAICLSALVGTAFGSESRGARHSATHTFEVEAAVADVFPLFLPEGESRWSHSWDPKPVVPNTIRGETNAVFVTNRHGSSNDVIWTIVNLDKENHVIEYLVTDPGYQQRWITIQCQARSAEATDVSVRRL